jgi:histidyl-tRNA synthetase
VDLGLKDQSLGKTLKRAGQSGARAAVVIGSAERDAGSLTVRDLTTGEERAMDAQELVAWAREAGRQ